MSMKVLRNEFSWSQSRADRLRTCPRAYYWQYYGKWEGWSSDAPAEAQKAYRLSKMTNLDLLAGSVVHDTAEEMVNGVRRSSPMSLERAREEARRTLNTGWRDSTQRRYMADPKNAVCLFEHYYGVKLTRLDTDRIRDKVLTCLENLARSKVLAFLTGLPPQGWLAVEDLDSFQLDDVNMFAKPDVAVTDGERFFLIDWKTGKQSATNDLQIAGYALYAMDKWEAEVGRIETVLVYLRDNAVRTATPDTFDLDRARETIRRSVEDMRSRLVDVEENVARIEDFPMTTNKRTCQRCFFQELCFPDGVA